MSEKSEVTKYYSNLSSTYDYVRLGNVKKQIISYFQLAWIMNNLKMNSVCLEVGCGTGRVTLRISRKASFLVATDCSREMIKINKSKMKFHKFGKVQYVICDASYLPFRGEYFEEVISARVFWHIHDYTKALTEALRVVKINNFLLFDFPCQFGPFSLHSKIFRIRHEVLTKFISSKRIRAIFKGSNGLIIEGNTSFLLFFASDWILRQRIFRRMIIQFEKLEYGLLKDLLYSYHLIKVIK